MRMVLYGLPCAGKTMLLSTLTDMKVVHGSQELQRLSGGHFSALSESQKNAVRIKYAQYLCGLTDDVVISDGHYSFLDQVVFTEADAAAYDVFLYLYCSPERLAQRYQVSEKNREYGKLPVSGIEQWQQFEIERLREECHQRGKDFYVLCELKGDTLSPEMFTDFVEQLKKGYSSHALAKKLVSEIQKVYPEPCVIHMTDGDKTLIKQDSFRLCGGSATDVFDGDFYTGYQSLQFAKETAGLSYDTDRLSAAELCPAVFDRIRHENYIVLSSGITALWDKLGDMFGISHIFADPLISADTKYYVVRYLRKAGYTVIAYGDSKNDLYMLREADEGNLCIGTSISRSLHKTDLTGLQLIYDKTPYILTDAAKDEMADDIAVCRSDSGVCGSRLAAAHLRLGARLGTEIRRMIPAFHTGVLVLERGGRFFGDGIYIAFGGVFYPYHPSKDTKDTKDTKDSLPDMTGHRIVVIVDSVINTGNSVIRLIDRLHQEYPALEIIIAANVIQKKALLRLTGYKIFAVRVSDNFYIGQRQAVQSGTNGPDTADRLYNLIG